MNKAPCFRVFIKIAPFVTACFLLLSIPIVALSRTIDVDGSVKPAPAGWLEYFRSPGSTKPWSMILGGAFIISPKYIGEKEIRVLPVPYFHIEYKRRFFLSSYQGLGVFLSKNKTFQVGSAINYSFINSSSGKNKYAGFDKIKNYISGDVFMRWRWRMLAYSSRYKKALSRDYGSTWRNTFGVAFPLSRYIIASIGPAITWSSQKYMQTNYGVSPQESQGTGFRVYGVHSGFSSLGFTTLMLFFHGRWFGQAMFSGNWLRGEASASPIVEKKFQYVGVVSLGYRFHF